MKTYLKLILDFRHYKNGPKLKELHNKLTEMYVNQSGSKIITDEERSKILLTENGRGAFMIFLRSLKANPGDEIIVPAYTCSVIPAAIITEGLKPVYAEVERDLTMSVEEIEKRITPRTKAILVQHTYCRESDMDKIMALARNKGIKVIEDCAHCVGFQKGERLMGLKGDVSMFSFGYSKVLPTRVGGFLLVNNDQMLGNLVQEFSKIPYTTWWRTLRWLINPLFWRLFRKTGFSGAVKYANIFGSLGLIDLPVDKGEIKGKIAGRFPTKLTNPLAGVVLHFLNEIDSNVSHRAKISATYQEAIEKLSLKADLLFECEFLDDGPYLKFPLILEDEETVNTVYNELLNLGFYIYVSTDVPAREEGYEALHYPAKDLEATGLAKRLLILPTDLIVSEEDARYLVGKIQSLLEDCRKKKLSNQN